MPDYFGEPTPTEQRYYDALADGLCACGLKDLIGRPKGWVPPDDTLVIDPACPVHGHLCPVKPQDEP